MSILTMSAAPLRTNRPLRWKQMKRLLREREQRVQHCELEGRGDQGLRHIGLSRAELVFEASKVSR